jgi:hypothetical protein
MGSLGFSSSILFGNVDLLEIFIYHRTLPAIMAIDSEVRNNAILSTTLTTTTTTATA